MTTLLSTNDNNNNDNLFDSESYLQLAVRWAHNPLQLINSMTNLGYYYYSYKPLLFLLRNNY